MWNRTLGVVLLVSAGTLPGWSPLEAQDDQSFSFQLPEDLRVERTVTVSDLSGSGYYPGGYTTVPTGPSNPLYQAGGAYDGVARLLIRPASGGTFGCTGSLLQGGLYLLTAAHCVYDFNTGTFVSGSSLTVDFFQTGTGTSASFTGAEVIGRAGYSGAVLEEQDLAIVRLDRAADSWIPQYSLFTGNPLYRDVSFVGYGLSGNGVTGGVVSNLFDPNPVRRIAQNRWEMTADEAGFVYVDEDRSTSTSILVSDFDGATPGGTYPTTGHTWASRTVQQNNTSCNIFASASLSDDLRSALCNSGVGLGEGLTGSGDSGGPAFINDDGVLRIAAVTSWGTVRCVPDQRVPARTSAGCPVGFITNGSYFGSLGGHVAVSYGANYDWAQEYVQAPTTVTPEPFGVMLLGVGLAGLSALRRRRRDELEA